MSRSNSQNTAPSGNPSPSGVQRNIPKFGGPYSSLSASSQRMQQYLSLVFSSDAKKQQGGRVNVNPPVEVEASAGNSRAVDEPVAIPMELEAEPVEITPMPDLVTSCVLSIEEQRKRYSRMMKSNKRMKVDGRWYGGSPPH